ncbi:cytochrome P450 [Aspergillus chevalieri]|uniref:Cytochrome P450 n=1 Tax=Aspergillus chevalieri TaxID=182096 RepID=A0A7R7VK59_ASPCH|nr:uncharacterized protein ACHE_30189S [Aspergillus chevalieri]BCR86202.1 hypothetical protein ACHE_30189S [Aspergillus chevalieri]
MISASSAILLAVLLTALWRLSLIGQRPKDYPPGPPTLPILGNLHQIPKAKRHIQFEKWARQYGPVYSLMLGTKVMIVLNTDDAIRELVDKRGAIYASRPESFIAQDTISGGLRILWMHNGETWKMARKLGHRILNLATARTYVPYQDLETKRMLLDFLEKPESFIEHMRRFSASLTTQMTFGFRTTTIHDPRFKESFDIFDESWELVASPIAGLMDFFPFLRKPCVCVDLVKLQKEESFSDDFAAYIGGSLLQAGSETTAGVLVGFIQAITIFPSVAKIAQAEIDRVCGDGLPDLNDVPDLPYVRACARETLRWMPGFLLGLPHAATRDDVYLGYRIPNKATILMNVWAVHNNPEQYPNPRTFDPRRYMDHEYYPQSAANTEVSRDHFAFGAGRRKCQGIHIAERSLFLSISRLLWAFDFKRTIDPVTKLEIFPNMDDLADGAFTQPNVFPARIVPRSEDKARRVREEWGKVLELLDGDMQWRTVPEGLIWRDYEIVA